MNDYALFQFTFNKWYIVEFNIQLMLCGEDCLITLGDILFYK